MDKTIDNDQLHAEINRRMPVEHQIQKDDPIFTGIILNKVALDSYVHLIQKNLDETLHQLTAASEQQVQNAEAIAEKLILRAGNNVENQLDVAAHRWEERLRKAGAETETNIRRASRLAWVGAMLIFISACILTGSCVGNAAFAVIHHSKQPPSKQKRQSKQTEGSKCQPKDGYHTG